MRMRVTAPLLGLLSTLVVPAGLASAEDCGDLRSAGRYGRFLECVGDDQGRERAVEVGIARRQLGFLCLIACTASDHIALRVLGTPSWERELQKHGKIGVADDYYRGLHLLSLRRYREAGEELRKFVNTARIASSERQHDRAQLIIKSLASWETGKSVERIEGSQSAWLAAWDCELMDSWPGKDRFDPSAAEETPLGRLMVALAERDVGAVRRAANDPARLDPDAVLQILEEDKTGLGAEAAFGRRRYFDPIVLRTLARAEFFLGESSLMGAADPSGKSIVGNAAFLALMARDWKGVESITDRGGDAERAFRMADPLLRSGNRKLPRGDGEALDLVSLARIEGYGLSNAQAAATGYEAALAMEISQSFRLFVLEEFGVLQYLHGLYPEAVTTFETIGSGERRSPLARLGKALAGMHLKKFADIGFIIEVIHSNDGLLEEYPFLGSLHEEAFWLKGLSQPAVGQGPVPGGGR